MLSKKGRLIFSSTVVAYWGIAWIIAVAIPSLGALFTLVGAAFILQFTYTFPPILLLGHWMQLDAMKADSPWRPGMVPGSNRIDTWRQKSRWIRGFKKYWYLKSLLVRLTTHAVNKHKLTDLSRLLYLLQPLLIVHWVSMPGSRLLSYLLPEGLASRCPAVHRMHHRRRQR